MWSLCDIQTKKCVKAQKKSPNCSTVPVWQLTISFVEWCVFQEALLQFPSV